MYRVPLLFPALLGVSLTLLTAPAAPARADATRVFGDWTASCWTRTRRCAAESDAIPGTGRASYRLTLSLARRDGARRDWEAGLRLRKPVARDAAIIVRIDDGTAFRFAPEGGYARSSSGKTVRFLPADRVVELLRAARAGSRAEVALAASGDGKPDAVFSLRGASDALDWINAEQGRRDDPTLSPPAAAVPQPPARLPEKAEPAKPAPEAEQAEPASKSEEEGPGGAPAAPPAHEEQRPAESPATTSQPALPPELAVRHAQKSDCDALGTGALAGRAPGAIALGERKTLYIVPCYAGADMLASRLYLVRDGDFASARTLYFANFSQSLGWYGSDTLINAAYDSETRTLSSQGTGQGKGGCGNAALYRWDGFDFRMIEYRAWDRCDGIRTTPSQWPVIYKASD